MIFWVVLAFLGNAAAGDSRRPASCRCRDSQAGTLRFILVGVALMLIVIFRPQGILGNKKEMTFVK